MWEKVATLKIFNLHPVASGIVFGTFLARAGYFMSIPFLGMYLNEVQGFNPATTGAILAVSYLVGTFMSFIGGSLSDRMGRYPVMIISILVWGGVFASLAFAHNVWMFFILNSLNGVCRSIFESTARALLVDITPEEDRMDVFNARYFAINIGGAVGPLIGLWLGASHATSPFLICAIIYVIYGFIIYYWKMKYSIEGVNDQKLNRIPFRTSLSIIIKDRAFCYFLLGNIFVTGGYAHLDTTLSQYMGSSHVATYSLLFMTNTITILVLQYPIIKLMKKFSALTSLKLGSLFISFGVLSFGLSHIIIFLILSMILFTVGEILCFIIGDVLIGEIAPENLRGAYFGASGIQFIGQSGGAWIGGILLNIFGSGQGPIIFSILALLTVIAYPFYQLGYKELKKGEEFMLDKAEGMN
jgi:MFS family permease